jgi:hypothetical protein
MVMDKHGVQPSSYTGFPMRKEKRLSAGCVLSGFDRTARIIVFVLHKEVMN